MKIMSCEDDIQQQVINMVNESDNCLNVAFLFFILSLCDITLVNELKHKWKKNILFLSGKRSRKQSKLLAVGITVSKGI